MSKLFIANWKSNKNREQVEKWMDTFEAEIKPSVALNKLTNEIVICPPMPSVMFVSDQLLDKPFHKNTSLGVQDISSYSAGSYTGGVSAENLSGFKVKYAIVGHSERRKYFHETSKDVAMKVEQCLENEITPIVCVDKQEIDAQANLIDKSSYKKIVMAYEPVEHIGTGVAEDVTQVLEVFEKVRTAFPGAKVIYGGSVNLDNLSQFLPQDKIEGFLVGSASLNAEQFVQMVKM